MRPTVEPLEGRIVLDGGPADLAMLSATTADSRSVTSRYEVTLLGSPPGVTAEVAFFRSADPVVDLSDDVRIDTQVVPLAVGEHTVVVSLPEALAIDPSHPYVLAVAAPSGELSPSRRSAMTSASRPTGTPRAPCRSRG